MQMSVSNGGDQNDQRVVSGTLVMRANSLSPGAHGAGRHIY